MGEVYEYISRARPYVFEGVTVLRLSLRYPQIGMASIDGFCAELAKSIEDFASGTLFPALCDEYLADTDPRRRFVFGYVYRFDCTVADRDAERIELASSLTLRRKGSAHEPISQEERLLTFRLVDGCLLPPKATSKRQKNALLTKSIDAKQKM